MDNSTNELWNIFYSSGKIDDYIKYRNSCAEGEMQNAVEHNRAGDTRTDDGRK